MGTLLRRALFCSLLVLLLAVGVGSAAGYFIRINPVGNPYAGEKFTLSAVTNLEPGELVFVEISCASLNPTAKSQSNEFSGMNGTVKVQATNMTVNSTAFDVDLSTLPPDTYECLATEKSDLYGIGDTTSFTVEPAPPTPSGAGPDLLVLAGGVLCGYGIIRRMRAGK